MKFGVMLGLSQGFRTLGIMTCSCCGVGVPGNDRVKSISVVKVVVLNVVKFKVEAVKDSRSVILRS